mgnify:CR=1 FL=1
MAALRIYRLSKQAISKQEYESTEASYSNAKAAFEYAQNTLNQTKLRAPFDGFIQKKYVENYQKVQAGQGIVCLINRISYRSCLRCRRVISITSLLLILFMWNSIITRVVRFKAKVESNTWKPSPEWLPAFPYICISTIRTLTLREIIMVGRRFPSCRVDLERG